MRKLDSFLYSHSIITDMTRRFHWVRCQLDTISKCQTPGDVEKALKTLPKDLNVTYERILLKILNEGDARAKIAEKILASFPTCPVPEIARLGRTLKRWSEAFLAYFDTGRSNNGGTEAINGLIELHRRLARGYRNRDNYRLRMLLIAGGLRT